LDKNGYKQHISEQFNAELDGVKSSMLEMGGIVEQQIVSAVNSLVAAETGEAELVIARDAEVNALEVAIDEECSRILARRQPAASDLRLVLAVGKVVNDLERIGDEAAKIARQAIALSERGVVPSSFAEMRQIGEHVTGMVRNALDAFTRLDADAALSVVHEDEEVDQQYAGIMQELMTSATGAQENLASVVDELWALRSLERIGDHAGNISEHVIYLVKGLDVRHVGVEEIEARLHENA
jgi:phosphate transport system protein